MRKASCIYFRRDGYCVNGNECQFSHMTPTEPCRIFFENNGKCKYGSACSFSHRKAESTVKMPRHSTLVSKQPPSVHVALDPSSNVENALSMGHDSVESDAHAFEFNSHVIDSIDKLWDFADTVQDDPYGGAYFYGAVGTFDTGRVGKVPVPHQQVKNSWVAIAKKNAEVAEESDQPETYKTPSRVHKRELCHFFQTGNCRYGNSCLNIHSLDGSDMDLRHNPTVTGNIATCVPSSDLDCIAVNAECGICFSPRPDDGLYGILSNCDCTFCLVCIRQWRTLHGKEISSNSSQVRLCPLCRCESYFTIPSMIPSKKSEKKDILIQNYRASLKKIQCKFSVNNQLCPFGSSCFYLHREEEKTVVRHLMNSNGQVEIKGEGMDLFCFVKGKLK